MNKLKNLCVLAGLLMVFNSLMPVLTPNISQGQSERSLSAARFARKFYLTNTAHDGNEVLTACVAGYHVASLWEIHNPTDLRYDHELGFTQADAGSGPPSGTAGWIRTGWNSDQGSFSGSSNCSAYTSDSPFGEGTAVSLQRIWRSDQAGQVSPWTASGLVCFETARVWCVQD
jgi:hypothetical protein